MEGTTTISSAEYLHLKNLEKQWSDKIFHDTIYIKKTEETVSERHRDYHQHFYEEITVVSKEEALKNAYSEVEELEKEKAEIERIAETRNNYILSLLKRKTKINLSLRQRLKLIVSGEVEITMDEEKYYFKIK